MMNTNAIEIRPYLPTDKNDLLQILRSNTPEYFAVEEENDFIFYLEQHIEMYYVVLLNHIIVGCGGINFNEDKTEGKLSWGMIHPDYQHQSIGKQLLLFRIQKLKTIATVQRITVRTSQLVYPFFEKLNFHLVERKKDFWAKGIDLCKMEYKI